MPISLPLLDKLEKKGCLKQKHISILLEISCPSIQKLKGKETGHHAQGQV